MSKFSDRYFNVDAKSFFQEDGMNDELKNSIFNSIHVELLSPIEHLKRVVPSNGLAKRLIYELYDSFFKKPVSEVKINISLLSKNIAYFIRHADWYQVYDIVEYLVQWVGKNLGDKFYSKSTPYGDFEKSGWHKSFVLSLNKKLQRENSVFRIVSDQVVKVTDPVEIDEIENAVGSDNPYDGARTHLKTALEILADRSQENYRNSIKESISAIESLARSVCGQDKGTLGALLKEMEKKEIIPEAMKSAYSKIYGFTSDASGIRHSLTDSDRPISYADAKYMLVVCSAFTSYVIEIMEK